MPSSTRKRTKSPSWPRDKPLQGKPDTVWQKHPSLDTVWYSTHNKETSFVCRVYLNFIGNFPIPIEAMEFEETPEEKELAEKRAGYRRKYQRRKELAAQRAAEAEQQNKANA